MWCGSCENVDVVDSVDVSGVVNRNCGRLPLRSLWFTALHIVYWSGITPGFGTELDVNAEYDGWG